MPKWRHLMSETFRSLRWFVKHLSGRRQSVQLSGLSFTYLNVTKGVPQSSYLEPTFFTIFTINLDYVGHGMTDVTFMPMIMWLLIIEQTLLLLFFNFCSLYFTQFSFNCSISNCKVLNATKRKGTLFSHKQNRCRHFSFLLNPPQAPLLNFWSLTNTSSSWKSFFQVPSF